MKRPVLRMLCVAGVAALMGLTALPTHASVKHTFSEFSSDETDPAVLTAEVTYTISGSQLMIEINNTSDYQIAQLYFNSDETLTGLAFDPGSSPNANWIVGGTGTSQTQKGDGMGKYNWVLDFGSGANRLLAGETTSLVLDVTGTTTEDTILNKLSINPPGNIEAVAVLKFEAGPHGDSAFGSGEGGDTPPEPPEPPVVPEPSSLALLSLALVGLGGQRYRRRKRNA